VWQHLKAIQDVATQGFVVTSIGGTSFDGSYSYNELTITTADNTSIFDGSMNIKWSDDGVVTEGSVDIPSLTYVFGEDGVKLSDYSLSFSEDSAQGTGWVDYQYTISSTILGGSVSVATTQRFDYYINADYPYAGQIVVSGADSQGKLTVVEGGTGAPTDYVLIELDADGDGVFEDSRQVQWQDLN
jgi:hypothetical protein